MTGRRRRGAYDPETIAANSVRGSDCISQKFYGMRAKILPLANKSREICVAIWVVAVASLVVLAQAIIEWRHARGKDDGSL